MRKLALIAALLALPGCATTLAYTRPPDDKLVCAGEPGRPAGLGPQYTDANGVVRRAVTDDENGVYLSNLRVAGQDCREDVSWMRDWFDKLGKRPR